MKRQNDEIYEVNDFNKDRILLLREVERNGKYELTSIVHK